MNKNCPLVNQWMFGGNKKCTNRSRSFDGVWYLSWYLIVENEYSIRWMNSEVFRWNRIAVSERRTTAVVRAQWNVHQLVFDSIHPNENNRQQQEQQQQHFQMHNKQKKNTIVPIVLRTQQWYHNDLAPNGCDMQCSLYSDFKTIQFAYVCLFPHQCNAMDLFVTIIYLHNQIIGCYSPCFVFLLAFFCYFFRSFWLLKKEAISQEQKYALHLHTNCCGIQLQLSLRILLSRWNFIFGIQSLTFYWKMNQFAFRMVFRAFLKTVLWLISFFIWK